GTPGKPLRNALYKNNRDGTFTDVTEKAGVAGGTFGMGVAVGDYDNDGWPDIFVTSYGRCILYKNNRNGTFTDVTEKAGLAAPGWTTSAVWFDFRSEQSRWHIHRCDRESGRGGRNLRNGCCRRRLRQRRVAGYFRHILRTLHSLQEQS